MEKETEPRPCRQPLEAGKDKENDSSLKPPEKEVLGSSVKTLTQSSDL